MEPIRRFAEAEKLIERCFCHCGRLRVKTPSGAACPKHKLVTGISEEDLRRAVLAKLMLGLARAERVGLRRWRINDVLYTRCRKTPAERSALLVHEFAGRVRIEVARFRKMKKQFEQEETERTEDL